MVGDSRRVKKSVESFARQKLIFLYRKHGKPDRPSEQIHFGYYLGIKHRIRLVEFVVAVVAAAAASGIIEFFPSQQCVDIVDSFLHSSFRS